MVTKKLSKKDAALLEGLPKSFTMTVDWDNMSAKCDADRRNCAIHHALKGRRDVTRTSVGLDEVNFIWRGDARVAVTPNAQIQKVIAKNDLASAGEIPWPTGQEVVRLDLSDARVKLDLRLHREQGRRRREAKPVDVKASREKWRDEERRRTYEERARKRLITERTKGRLV